MGHRDSLPDGLAWGRPKRNTYDVKAGFRDSSSAPRQRRIPIDLKDYNSGIKEKILAFKAAADTLASYGIIDKNSMDMFLKEVSDKAKELDSLKTDSSNINLEIKELFKLNEILAGSKKPYSSTAPCTLAVRTI